MIKSKICTLLLFIALLLSEYATCQQIEYKFNYITNDEGLSSNNVRCIYEDSNGFIWFGTQDGLNRYDGITSRIYRSKYNDSLSLSNNSINCIIEEPGTSNLWIGTVEGLNYFNKGSLEFQQYVSRPGSGTISNNYIYDVIYDNEGTLWIGTEHGLNEFKEGKFKSYVVPAKKSLKGERIDNSIKAILPDSTFLWIGTGEAVYKFDLKSHQFIHAGFPKEVRDVNYINSDSWGNLWFHSYSDGLFILEKGTSVVKNIEELCNCTLKIKPQGLVEDNYGNLLIANRDQGLSVFNFSNRTLKTIKPDKYKSQSLNSKALINIFKSESGLIWIGTYNSGVNYYDPRKKDFNLFKVNFKDDGLINENIRSVFCDSEDNIWIGTKEGGCLSKFIKETGTFIHYPPDLNDPNALHGDYILRIEELDKDHLLIGTLRHGINVYNKRTGYTRHFKNDPDNPNSIRSNAVYNFLIKNANEVWVATNRGLDIWHIKENKFEHIKSPIDIRCFYVHDDGKIWAGAYKSGIHIYDSAHNLIGNYKHDFHDTTTLGGDDINSIKQDSFGTIWICSTSGGLNYYKPESNSFARITEKDGLANDHVCDILFYSDKEYWISTGKGLSVYYPQENRFKNYDRVDGLQGNEFADNVALKTSSGEMLFGGRKGFNFFKPEDIIENTQKPKVVITDLFIHNKPVKIEPNSPLTQSIEMMDHITFTHKDFIFSFGFAALNYLSPEKNQYMYKLEGFDSDWVKISGKPVVTYTNIPPGHYTFRVKASNNDGYWNEEGTSLSITILPPWWKTLWFQLCIIAFSIFITYYIIHLRIKRLKESKRELEEQVSIRTEQLEHTLTELKETQAHLVQSEKMTSLGILTAGVAHEINNPLNFIQGGIYGLETIEAELQGEESVKEDYITLLDGMDKGVKRLSSIVKTLNTFSRKGSNIFAVCDIPEIIDNCLLILNHEIKGACEVQKDYCKDSFEFKGNQERLHQVFLNLIMNAIQAMPENGKLKISTRLYRHDKQLEVIVSDNGTGITKDNLEKIFDPFFTTKDPGKGTGLGLSIVFKIITNHKGSIKYYSEPGKGTDVKILLPIE